MTRLIARALLVAACAAPAAATPAAAQPLPSVLDLFDAIPEPPATAEAAGAWFDASGTVVYRPLVELKGRIARLTTSLESRRAALARQDVAQGQRAVADLGQGLANAGIDIVRMQSDPAYAAQMQATLKSMTPQQLMALSMTMTAPMNADAALVNQAQAMGADNDAATAAADVATRLMTTQAERIAARGAVWARSDAAVARLDAAPPAVTVRKPAQQDGEGCDTPCLTALRAYRAAVRAALVTRDTQVLASRRPDFETARAAAAPLVREADGHLRATRYGETSTAQVNKSRILSLAELALGEVVELVNRLEAVAHEGARAIRTPDSLLTDDRD